MLTTQRTKMLEGLHQLVLHGNGLQMIVWVRGDQDKANSVCRIAKRKLETALREINQAANA